MKEVNLFDQYIIAVSIANTFASLSGECDEFMQFVQLEWESYAEEFTREQERNFYYELKWYKDYRKNTNRDWRDSFSGRNHFGTIV